MANPKAEAITMAAITPAEMEAASTTMELDPVGHLAHPVSLTHPPAQAEGHWVGVNPRPLIGSQ